METFLTKSEIKELTGYTYKRRQCQELGRMGIKFIINSRFGHPIVMRRELEAQACSNPHKTEPTIDRDALKEVS